MALHKQHVTDTRGSPIATAEAGRVQAQRGVFPALPPGWATVVAVAITWVAVALLVLLFLGVIALIG